VSVGGDPRTRAYAQAGWESTARLIEHLELWPQAHAAGEDKHGTENK
jgi:hypothetical protein